MRRRTRATWIHPAPAAGDDRKGTPDRSAPHSVMLERFGVNERADPCVVNLRREDLDDPDRSAPFARPRPAVRRCACAGRGAITSGCCSANTSTCSPLASPGDSPAMPRRSAQPCRISRPTSSCTTVAARSSVDPRRPRDVRLRHPRAGHPALGPCLRPRRSTAHGQRHAPALRRDWQPDAVLLPRKRPPDIRPYRDRFAAPLRFDSIMAGIMFPERCLSQPIADADPLPHRLLRRMPRGHRAGRIRSCTADVRRTIRLLLLTQRCSRGEVARRLGLASAHPGPTAAVHRRDLPAAARRYPRGSRAAAAARHPHYGGARRRDAGLPGSDVFTRAFTRWTGRTPIRVPRGTARHVARPRA